MKLRLGLAAVLALVLAWSAQPQAVVTVVDSCYQDEGTGDTTTSCTLTGLAAGDAIVACGQVNNIGTAGSMVLSDDQGNTYQTSIENDELELRYALNVAGATTAVTLTVGTTDFRGVYAVALRNVLTAAAIDDSDVGAGVGTSATTPALTASAAGVSVACLSVTDTATTLAAAGGYTQLEEDESWTNVAGALAWQLTTAGSYTPTETLGTSGTWQMIGVVLKEVVAAGGGARTLSTTGASR